MSEPTENSNEQTEAVRLPIWKHALEQMRLAGIEYGKTFTAEWFEEHLRTRRDTMGFGLSISEIRRELEWDGYYLSGRGQKGDQFVIMLPESNQDVMRGYGRAALDALKRGVILGTNTRLDSLTANERRKHESLLEKLAFKLALCSKAGEALKAIGKERADEMKQQKIQQHAKDF